MAKLLANSGDPDQTLHSAASDLGLHCLPVALLWVSQLQWVKKYGKEITHCSLNKLSHTIYWKSPFSILGTSGYMM